MNKLLGLDETLLSKVGLVERGGYRLVNILFLIAVIMSLLSNGYFGYLLLRTWWSALSIGLLMGYIHFSVLRIALITLMTKPMIDPVNEPQGNHATIGRIGKAINYIRQLNGASILRFIFVGLIAITISVPFSTIFFHAKAMSFEQQYREQLTQALQAQQSADVVILREMERAHYPFVIFEKLSADAGYLILMILVIALVFSPLVALAKLRYGKNNKYVELCREAMQQEIMIDYLECLEQSQFHLDLHFPDFKKKLTALTPFADAPFRQKLKDAKDRKWGDADEFRQYMRSI